MAGQEAYFNLGINNEQDQTKRNYFSLFPEEIIASVLDAFVINKPMSGKVGGDGFWVHQIEDELIIALFDCMGHGHLASMMTRIYIQHLDNIVKTKKVTDPGTILRYVHHHMSTKYQDKSNLRIETSADFGIINVNLGVKKVEYSGAKIDLIQVSGDSLKEINADRLPVGDLFEFPRRYQTKKVSLKEGEPSYIYLATDGLKDQLGGPNEKKLGKKAVQKCLNEMGGQSMQSQKTFLEKFIADWRGSNEQTDDILVLGLCI